MKEHEKLENDVGVVRKDLKDRNQFRGGLDSIEDKGHSHNPRPKTTQGGGLLRKERKVGRKIQVGGEGPFFTFFKWFGFGSSVHKGKDGGPQPPFQNQ